ncbi:hypothetical protein [Legionella saoudiensis]|uniref:hypothetical protein n=1 Tax=Legionella saoudiensis TaxID=1750561 RepID=UPI0007308B6D|nr:hypothetical protein [Legionella saoudiensis]
MKKLIIGFFILGSSISFAATQTSMDSKWICTTNASSSDNPSDKSADDKMANTQNSAAKAFAFAAENCRDCTKITCEVKD